MFNNFLFWILALFEICNGINILMVLNDHGHSHVAFMNRIAEVLIDGGHNVTIFQMPLSPFVTLEGTPRASRVIRYKTKNVDYDHYRNMTSVTNALLPTRKPARDIPGLYKQRYLVCEEIVNDDTVISMLNSTKFDIGMAEIIEICQEGLFEILGIQNVIHTSAISMYTNIYRMYGIPQIPSFMPHMMFPFSQFMNLKERFSNFYVTYKLSRAMDVLNDQMTDLYRGKYGPDFPHLMELRKKKANFIFMNNNEHLDFPNLVTPKVKYVGGLENPNHAPLTEKLIKIIEKYKGFVVFSFGSILKTKNIPEIVKKEVVSTFKIFPNFAFIWKFDKKEVKNWDFLDGATNVYFENWLPQYALLNHEKCRVFISHVGYNSFQESIMAGIPIIAIPLFADQFHNAAVVGEKKLGILLGKDNLNKIGLTKALQEMLTDTPSVYHITAKKFAERIIDGMKIMSPKNTILKFVDYAHKHGNLPDMELSTKDLSFVQLYLLDIFAIISIAVTIVLIVSYFLIRWIIKSIFSKKKEKKINF